MSGSEELLPTVNYRHLISLDRSIATYESAILLRAATTLGFFYLDLRGNRQLNERHGDEVSVGDVLEMQRLEEVMKGFFKLEMAEKMEYRIMREGGYGSFGYKPPEIHPVDEAGTPDSNEFYNISLATLLTVNPPLTYQPQPPAIVRHLPLLRTHLSLAYAIALTILRHLSASLNVCNGSDMDLPCLHPLHSDSNRSQLTLVNYPPTSHGDATPTMPSHTDSGSLSIIVTSGPGLDILSPPLATPETATSPPKIHGTWIPAPAKPEHVMVNFRDAIAKMTGSRVRAAVHRFVNAGQVGEKGRWSVIYFLQPVVGREGLVKVL